VVRTTALSGEVHLDGRDSVVEIDLQQLSSDSSFRDRYIRSRMFGRDPIAVFTITDLGQLPEGFTDGEVVTGQVHGELLIRVVTAPLTFDVEARDDGDVVFIIGRTTFTWDDLQIAKPTARPVVSVEDEVRVEVLLSVTPKLASEG
jgi:polyisoprenoid-binding protein YceI